MAPDNWQLLIIVGWPGDYRDTQAEWLIRGIDGTFVVPSAADRPLIAPRFAISETTGPPTTIVAEATEDSPELLDAVRRLIEAGHRVVLLVPDLGFMYSLEGHGWVIWLEFADPPVGSAPPGGGTDGGGMAEAPAGLPPLTGDPAHPEDAEYADYAGYAGYAEYIEVEPAERRVNLVVADLDRGERGTAVAPGSRYLLRVGIGERPPESILAAWTPPFPFELLDPSDAGWWLQAVVSANGAPIAIGGFFLPRTGESFCCPCRPGGRHHCRPGQRESWLDLVITAPHGSGEHHLQVGIHHGAATVQAFEVTVTVSPHLTPAPAQAREVYTLSTALQDLDRFAGRRLSIRDGADRGGHYLIVHGADGLELGFTLTDPQAGSAARTLRNALFDRQLAKRWGRWRSRYDRAHGKTFDAYAEDLLVLARAGAEAFAAVVPDPLNRLELTKALRATDDQIPVIQVAQAENTRPIVPWQFVYDLPLLGYEQPRTCRSVSEFGPGATTEDIPPRCPYAEDHGEHPGTLCPFGFWGLANIIEVPPSSRLHTLTDVTGESHPPWVIVAMDDSLRRDDWAAHLETLHRLGTPPVVATDVHSLYRAVGHGADLIYFLCHGRHLQNAAVALDLGRGGRLTAPDIAGWAGLTPQPDWRKRRPFVVLNGCHTGERLPETLVDFVDVFIAATGAAGVLATEVAMDRRLACSIMDAFVAGWSGGLGVGAALRRMRWQMLRRGNVMGLAYSPYCDANLRLPRPGKVLA